MAPKRDPKPVEQAPSDSVPLPFDCGLLQGGRPYIPRDRPVQEDWESVARKFGVDVDDLIFFNFATHDPAVVNWYLHHYTHCNKPSPSGNNWMFSGTGVIYIPPIEVDADPVDVCVWMPDNAQTFMMRLSAIAKGISGNKGQRIKKLVQVILKAGYPGCNGLWYYNDMVIGVYVDWKTGDAKRREMTKVTSGAFPFDGDSGVHGQAGSGDEAEATPQVKKCDWRPENGKFWRYQFRKKNIKYERFFHNLHRRR